MEDGLRDEPSRCYIIPLHALDHFWTHDLFDRLFVPESTVARSVGVKG